MAQVKVYGAQWCHDTVNTLKALEALGVDFDYFDVDDDPDARAWVLQQNGGKQETPTVDVAGEVLSVPDDESLKTSLRANGLVL